MLIEKLKEDHMVSRRSKNTVLSNLLGTVLAECQKAEKNGKTERVLTDGEVLAIIQATKKKVVETISLISGYPDRKEQLLKMEQERDFLDVYIPSQLTEDEIKNIALNKDNGTNMGQIMAFLKTNHAGKYDSKSVSVFLKTLFQ